MCRQTLGLRVLALATYISALCYDSFINVPILVRLAGYFRCMSG